MTTRSPLQPQRELELSGVGGGGGLSGQGVEDVYVRHVEAISDVEHVGDAFEAEVFSERKFSRHAQIVEQRPGANPLISTEIACQAPIDEASLLEETRRRVFGGDGVVSTRGVWGVRWDRIWTRPGRCELNVVSVGVMILNGRPEATSMMVEKLQSLNNLLLRLPTS